MITHYPKDWIARASAHFVHACEKHPHFADSLMPTIATKDAVRHWLMESRETLRECAKRKHYDALAVLECEVAEAMDAVHFKSWDDAIDEIYDAVAVLLRMAEMVEEKRAKAGGKQRETRK